MEQLRRLLGYIGPYKRRVALAIFLSFAVAGMTSLSLSTLIPILETLFETGGLERFRSGFESVVGRLLPELAGSIASTFFATRMSTLVSLVGLVFAMTLMKGVLRFLNDYIVGTVAVAASRDLQNRLFARLIRQPVLFFEREGVGTVASRFTADGDEVVRALKTFTGTVFREPIQFFFLLGLAFLISPTLTLASLVVFPLIGYLIHRAGRAAKLSARRVLGHRSRLLSLLQESFFGIRVVQAYGGEDRETERFTGENQRLFDRTKHLIRVESFTSPAMETLVVLGVGATLLLGGAMAIRGELPASRLVTLYVAVGALYEPIRKLGSAVPRIQTGLAGAGRIFAYLDREPEVSDAPGAAELPPLSTELRLEGVGVTYGGRANALMNVSLSIPAGSWVSIVGPSGSGKSTLLNLLPRFFDPDSGSVRFDGADIRGATLASLRGQIALVPQETVLMNDSLRANIAFARPGASLEEIRDAARMAHVTEFAERLPHGLDSNVGERGSSLSGGQRQRIAIARALLARPRLLLLDEATSNVDEESARLILSTIRSTREGRTTIVVSHRIESLADSDVVVLLSRGSVAATGAHEDLQKDSAAYRDFLRSAGAEEPGRSEGSKP